MTFSIRFKLCQLGSGSNCCILCSSFSARIVSFTVRNVSFCVRVASFNVRVASCNVRIV